MTDIKKIKVLIVDDHPLMRSGIAGEVNEQADMQVVSEAADGNEALVAYRAHRPDVTLMDLRMPNVNGLDAMLAIKKEFPEARFIVLTTVAGDIQVVRAFEAGARGYLLKNLVRTELIDTIRAVHAGKKRVPTEIAKLLAEHSQKMTSRKGKSRSYRAWLEEIRTRLSPTNSASPRILSRTM